MQHAFIERFDGLFREDILDAYLFEDLENLRLLADEWMDVYNRNHPIRLGRTVTPNLYQKPQEQTGMIPNTIQSSMNEYLQRWHIE